MLRRLLAGVTVIDCATLHWCAPDLGLLRDLSAPHAWLARAGTDAAAATFARSLLWLVAAWVAMGLTASLCAVLPGGAGALGRWVAVRITPAAFRQVLAASVAVSVLSNPVVARASGASDHLSPPSAASVGWPTDDAAPPAARRPPAAPQPGAHPRRTSRPSGAASTKTRAPGPATTTVGPRTAGGVVVRPGESLWQIAAHRLVGQRRATPLTAAARAAHPVSADPVTAAQIAAEWPRWYATNRLRIGADPDLLHPGERLTPPRGEK
jgi:hypothetical protein